MALSPSNVPGVGSPPFGTGVPCGTTPLVRLSKPAGAGAGRGLGQKVAAKVIVAPEEVAAEGVGALLVSAAVVSAPAAGLGLGAGLAVGSGDGLGVGVGVWSPRLSVISLRSKVLSSLKATPSPLICEPSGSVPLPSTVTSSAEATLA